MSRFPFDLEIPILQAPIGGASNPDLCVAVSEAGAMGGLALSWTAPKDAGRMVEAVRARTDRPFYVNFALAFEPVALGKALAAGAPCVTFSWGDPSPYVELVRSSGARIGVQVANVCGALRALELGADFLICQGVEAGGHVQSTTALELLLLKVVEIAAGVPVVAAGGISTGVGIARAIQSGASAVAMGTRFLATVESGAHDTYKYLLADLSTTETALTICFDGGWPNAPHRVLRNSTLETWEAAGCPRHGKRPGEGDTLAHDAEGEWIRRYEDTQPLQCMVGAIEGMCLYAGAGCRDIRDVPSASDLIFRLWEEAKRAL